MSSPQASQRPSTSWKRRCFVASENDRAAVRRNGFGRPARLRSGFIGATFLPSPPPDPAGTGPINSERYRNLTGIGEMSRCNMV
jgi:hypothetical protein